MSIFKCKMCGGTLEIQPDATVAECEYCGTKQTLPKLDDGRKANLFDRANHFRRNNEFDKAANIYEQILNEDGTDAETYWSLVLCRYGIEYVEDPATHKRVPTVNRAQFTSIFDDDNYKSALQYADGYQRSIYEDEAKAINEIQKGILAISQKEEPFDVFICYKETDNSGRRTPDSVLATDLYHQLTQEGFKVFFSRITLEDKLGTAYEPYIFAALNSAKVMVVLGTKPEYFNAVWVKNEWSRYLALIKSGAKKLLIPAYKDMDPYDLPEEFSHLQAQDMSKLGFMQDLIRGIKKILSENAPKPAAKETIVVNAGNASIAPLLKRAFMFLEDGDWRSANEYCEKVLDQDPENAEAYLGKLMAELRVGKRNNLTNCSRPFNESSNYQKAIRFGDDKLIKELKSSIKQINERNRIEQLNNRYDEAMQRQQKAKTEDEYKEAANSFACISGHKDADERQKQCLALAEEARKNAIYESAAKKAVSDQIDILEDAIKLFQTVPGWKDVTEQILACQRMIEDIKRKQEEDRLEKLRLERIAKREAERRARKIKKIVAIVMVIAVVSTAAALLITKVIIPNSRYNDAVALMNAGQYEEAISIFKTLDGHKDSEKMVSACKYNQATALLESGDVAGAMMKYGEIMDYSDAREKVSDLHENFVRTGTIGVGANHVIGVKNNGKVVAVGTDEDRQCQVEDWSDMIAVDGGYAHTVGLRSDGTVAAVGDNKSGQCEVSNWTNVSAITVGNYHTVGLKNDGTVVAVGSNGSKQCKVSDWTSIIDIAAGYSHTVGLKADGTVVAVGDKNGGKCDVSEWTDIVAIAAGNHHTVGLKSDGTVVAVGNASDGQCSTSGWSDIIAIAAGGNLTVGLRSDGTVVTVGSNAAGQRNVGDWTDIIAIGVGVNNTVGLRSDGTTVITGSNKYGQKSVNNWVDIKVPN